MNGVASFMKRTWKRRCVVKREAYLANGEDGLFAHLAAVLLLLKNLKEYSDNDVSP